MKITKNRLKWIVITVLGILLLSYTINDLRSNNTNDVSSQYETDRPLVALSEDQKTEIFYKVHEGYDAIKAINNPEVKDQAIRIVADEYNLSTKQVQNVIQEVENRQPTQEEFRIFDIYDKRLDDAIDLESEGKGRANEDAIRLETANELGIPEKRLASIWIRVSAWKGEHE